MKSHSLIAQFLILIHRLSIRPFSICFNFYPSLMYFHYYSLNSRPQACQAINPQLAAAIISKISEDQFALSSQQSEGRGNVVSTK